MNDQAPPRSRPPQAGKKPPMSRESRFVGYMVLGFGILAVIAVVIIAMGGRSKAPSQQVAQPEQQKLDKELMAPPVVAKPAPKKELYFERESSFDAKKMEGDWQGTLGKYTAVLQIKNGVYQYILAQPDPMAPRRYSIGNYKVREDIIVFTPRLDWPEPKSTSGEAVKYQLITGAAFPIIAVLDGKKMLWQNPPQSETRVLVPNNSPLFLSEDINFIVWHRLD